MFTPPTEIRWPQYNLYERVLRLAAEEIDKAKLDRPFIRVAGIAGPTEQAVKEAAIAKGLGYHIGLVSLGGLKDYSEDQLVKHVAAVAEVIPVFGFYLQPSVGGRILSYDCWRQLADIPNLLAIKTAPFNRYQTLDVFRAVCNSERRDEIAMYTGNDDNIVADLLTVYRLPVNGKIVENVSPAGCWATGPFGQAKWWNCSIASRPTRQI